MLEGLAGADLSANRAQASLSDALLKFDMTLWTIGRIYCLNRCECKQTRFQNGHKCCAQQHHCFAFCCLHSHFTQSRDYGIDASLTSPNIQCCDSVFNECCSEAHYTSTPVLCYCCCCRYRHAIVADNSANCATHTTHTLKHIWLFNCPTTPVPPSVPLVSQCFHFKHLCLASVTNASTHERRPPLLSINRQTHKSILKLI